MKDKRLKKNVSTRPYGLYSTLYNCRIYLADMGDNKTSDFRMIIEILCYNINNHLLILWKF